MGIALAIVSWGGGVWMGVLWMDNVIDSQRKTHKREMDEIFEEIKRCRAQVASLIGKE
jgi:hypothetical protein